MDELSPERFPSYPRRIQTIHDWLADRGADVDCLLLVSESSAERGVRARRDIQAGERVLTIPRSCLLTVSRDANACSHSRLATHLLEERDDPRSAWRAYLDGLPTSFPLVPLFYGEDDLALLRGSYLLDKIALRRASLRDEFAWLSSVGLLAGASFDAFVWAQFVVCSRGFGVDIAGNATLALVPLGDMLNHRLSPDVHWGYVDEDEAFFMTATRDIRAGEPVHDSYGAKCNGRFLLSYGFVLDDNPDNTAEIRLSVPRSDPLFEAKVRLLEHVSCSFLVDAHLGSAATRSALSFLRVAHASETELRAVRMRDPFNVPLGPRSEARALAALATACANALDRSPTTVEDDEALLRSGALSPSARNCVVMRRGEKRVLLGLRAAASIGRDDAAATPVIARRETRRLGEARTARIDDFDWKEAWQS